MILIFIIMLIIITVIKQRFTLPMRYKVTFHSQWGNNSIKAPQHLHTDKLFFLIHDGSKSFFNVGDSLKEVQEATLSSNALTLPGQISTIIEIDKKNNSLSFITNLKGCDMKDKIITGIPGSVQLIRCNSLVYSITIPMYVYSIGADNIVGMVDEGSIYKDLNQPIGYLEIQRM